MQGRQRFAKNRWIWTSNALTRPWQSWKHLSAPSASNAGYFGTNTSSASPADVSLPAAVNHEWLGAIRQPTPAPTVTGAAYHANADNGNVTLYTEVAYVQNNSTSNLGLEGGLYGDNINDDPVNTAHLARIRIKVRVSSVASQV